MRTPLPLSLAAFAAALSLVPAAASADVQTELVSRAGGFDGAPAGDHSTGGSVSADGRFVAFASQANGLSTLDDDQYSNVFVRDRLTGTTELISRAPGGMPANNHSSRPQITPDGRYVVFESQASNLSAFDTNGATNDIFRYDRETGTLTMVSRANGVNGTAGDDLSLNASISDDGNKVVFESDADNLSAIDGDTFRDVFLRDIAAGTTTLVSRAAAAADGNSQDPMISGDGTDVVFVSDATNLAGGDDLPGVRDVFVRHLASQTTSLVSRAAGVAGAPGSSDSLHPAISRTGRYVAFATGAPNLSGDDDDAAFRRVLRRDLVTNQVVLVSRADGANGTPNPGIADNPAISADGTTIAFSSSDQLVPEAKPATANVYVRTVGAGTTVLATRASGVDGAAADGGTDGHAISADGQTVVFRSIADNLTPIDLGATWDVFARGPAIKAPVPVPAPQDGGGGDGGGGGGGGAETPAPADGEAGPASTPAPPASSTTAPTGQTRAPKVGLRLLSVGARQARVRVSCPANAAAACRGTLTLRSAATKGKGRVLGTARFTVRKGGRRVVKVALRPAARVAVAKASGRKLRVQAVARVRAADSPVRTVRRALGGPRRVR